MAPSEGDAMDTTFNMEERSDAILSAGEAEPLEAWTPEDFDHFTDIGLLRPELRDLG
jgi:hypothetical protein